MRLLIAEDDSIILKGLVTNIDWKQCGISEVETAADGEIALDKISVSGADILITDINMPFVDGLELTERAKSINPDLAVIILTGYDTFDYAKKALQLGVIDYLMKPVRSDELRSCVQKASDLIRQKRRNAFRLEKSYDLLRSDTLERLFVHGIIDDDFPDMINNGKGPFSAAIARIEDYEKGFGFSADSDEISYSLIEYCDERLGDDGVAWIAGGEYIHIILSTAISDGFLQDFRQYAAEHAKTSLVISIGSSVSSIFEISSSAEEAFSLQKHYGLLSHNAIISLDSAGSAELDSLAVADCIKQIRFYLEEGSADDCASLLSSIIESSSIDNLSANLMLLLFHIIDGIRSLMSHGIIRDDSYNPDKLIPEFYGLRTVDQQEEYISELLKKLCACINDSSSSDPINMKMAEYVAAHYKEPMLSLTALGDYMDMSPVYLSSIFKKKNGVSFSQYLTDLRFSEACRLLRSTSMKNYEISASVGIMNAQYFCARFKRMYGCTPQEYREK